MSPPLSAGELMSTDLETVGPATLLRAVAEYLHGTGVGSVVVTEDDGVPIGIVTNRDLSRAVAEGANLDQERAAATMSEQLITVTPETTAAQAAATMRSHGVHHLLVIEDGELAGIVTATDLAYALPDDGQADPTPTLSTADPSDLYDAADWRFEEPEEWTGNETTLSVGETFAFEKTLSDADVEAFATATGDTNPLHLDDEYARRTRFRGRIVHGLLTAGVVSATVARLPGMIIYLGQDCEFTAPVEPGERVRVDLEVVENLGDEQYRLQTIVTDSDGKVVLDGEARVLVDEGP